MNHLPLCNLALRNMRGLSLRRKAILLISSIFIFLMFLFSAYAAAQAAEKAAAATPVKVEQELISTEMGFYEAWKTRDQAYFRSHMPENGIFWSESGVVGREQQLQLQQIADKTCNVSGYGLTDFGVLPIAAGAYLLTYKVDQYATCNGEKLPVHMHGSSIYVSKAGHWQAIYRAEVPLNQP
jgi:hypothetical protein